MPATDLRRLGNGTGGWRSDLAEKAREGSQIRRNCESTYLTGLYLLFSTRLRVSAVVFLRAVNVGGTNRCRPASIARQLAKFDVVNIGAVGTFVVRGKTSESTLRSAIAKKLPFKCDIMIVPAKAIVDLVRKDPFARQPSGPDITRFAMMMHEPLRSSSARAISSLVTGHSSLSLPSANKWLLKLIAIEDRFVLGLYRREMKAISYLGKIEKLLGAPATTRNWNTIEKVVKILKQDFP